MFFIIDFIIIQVEEGFNYRRDMGWWEDIWYGWIEGGVDESNTGVFVVIDKDGVSVLIVVEFGFELVGKWVEMD